jgi:hypothetical protein
MSRFNFNLKVLCLIPLLFLFSCSKDQKLASRIQGDWEVSQMTINGNRINKAEFEDIQFQFDNCRVKQEECNGRLVIDDVDKGKIRKEFIYQIYDKGNNLSLIYLFSGGYQKYDYQIIGHNKSRLKLQSNEKVGEVVQEWVKIKKKWF